MIVLSIGANLGDRLASLRTAVEAFRPWITQSSSVYETPPWGDEDQPDYLNAVLMVRDRGATATTWLDRAQQIEEAAGRLRDPDRQYGPRTLDIDIIAAGSETINTPRLTVPHPRAHLRAFVLIPWLEIDREALIPGRGSVAELLTELPAEDIRAIRRRSDLVLR